MSDPTAPAGMPAHAGHILDGMFAAARHLGSEVSAVVNAGATLASSGEGKTILALVRGVLIGRGVDPAVLDESGELAQAAFAFVRAINKTPAA